nr:hypothetical protein CFP56_31899 [Quercus suber]
MERSIVVENHCKSNVNTVSKSDGPFIWIDSISIDLVSVRISVMLESMSIFLYVRCGFGAPLNIISHVSNSHCIITLRVFWFPSGFWLSFYLQPLI